MPSLHESFDGIETKDLYKMKIASALALMLDEEPFDKISVCNICHRAGVSRQTFYRHFGTKFEVVQWYWLLHSEKYLFRVGRELTWHESFLLNFESIDGLLDFFWLVSKERGPESCVEFGERSRVESLVDTVTNYVQAPLTSRLQAQIEFFACAEARMLGRKMLHNANFDPAWLADTLDACVPPELHDLLDTHVRPSLH